MAIRAVIGFEHLPQNDVSWINYATHGMYRGADLSAQNTIVNGWLVSNATASGAERTTIVLDPYLVAPVAKIWFGFRCRSVLNARGGAGLIYLNGTYIALDSIFGLTGTTSYYEFSYELSTGTVERWVNGVKIANSAAGGNLRAMTLGLEVKGSLNGRYDFRDFYICDDQPGGPVGPLGPQVVYPITLDSATASDWTTTPSNATLLEALSDPGAIPTAKIASSTLTKGPLTASLKTTAPSTVSIAAIELLAGARSGTGNAAKIGAKLTLSGTDTAGVIANVAPTTYSYNVGLGVFQKNPQGASWSAANIDATTLTLTPDA